VALGNGGDPAAVPALVEALGDAEPLVRGHAAWALGRLGTGEARRGLEVALGAEREAWVREEIAHALSGLHDCGGCVSGR
jgi:epoxyqueuosine reductase